MRVLFDRLLNGEGTCFDRLHQPLPPIFQPPYSLKLGLAALFQTFICSQRARVLVLPTVLRLTRCSDEDLKALDHFMAVLANVSFSQKINSTLYSYTDQVLGVNIIQGEMLSLVSPPPTLVQIERLERGLMFSAGGSVTNRFYYDFWDRYEPDEYANGFFKVNGLPVLMMNGNLDPQTPLYLGTEVHRHLVAGTSPTSVTFELVDLAVHCTMANSPVDNSDVPCGLQMMLSWLGSGLQAVNTTCLAHLLPVDWEGTTPDTQDLSTEMFGVPDLWQL
eukprot:TRINITY_DN4799_c0_g1_i4.p1 TRINITY_DN4799_c0_g1~~TRINITY_DN4799_c0_g1_i4.p1  ORF type:complete len:276 (+),score=72.77 TRINITY_DN4799_c0_g1_i4:839-1666(+)